MSVMFEQLSKMDVTLVEVALSNAHGVGAQAPVVARDEEFAFDFSAHVTSQASVDQAANDVDRCLRIHRVGGADEQSGKVPCLSRAHRHTDLLTRTLELRKHLSMGPRDARGVVVGLADAVLDHLESVPLYDGVEGVLASASGEGGPRRRASRAA